MATLEARIAALEAGLGALEAGQGQVPPRIKRRVSPIKRMGRVDRCRFGWRVSPSNNQNLWPDLEEQKTIRIAKDFAAQGLSYRENPQRLDQLGRPRRGKKWSPGGHGLRRFYSGRAMCLRADWFFRRGRARLSTALPGIAQKPMGGQIGCCGVPPRLQPPPQVYWWVFARCSSGSLLGGLNWAGGDRLFLPFDGRFRPDLAGW